MTGLKDANTPRPVLLFCQAALDLGRVLTIREHCRGRRPVRVYVVQVESLYRFLRESPLQAEELVFLPYPALSARSRNPQRILAARRHLNEQYRRHFLRVRDADVYYWNNYFDWLTPAHLRRLARENRVWSCQLDTSDFTPLARTGPLQRLQLLALRYVTGVRFHWVRTQRVAYDLLAFPRQRYGIRELAVPVDPAALEQYRVRPEAGGAARSVLILDDPSPEFGAGRAGIMRDVARALRAAGWRIHVKGHPRIGGHDFWGEFGALEVPAHVPAEFLAVEDFRAVLAISSSALASLAGKFPRTRVISLLDLFPFATPELKNGYRAFLEERAPALEFAADLQDLLRRMG